MSTIIERTRTNVINRFVNWMKFRRACEEMYQLSDATLNDIGVSRGQIRAFIAASMQDEQLQASNQNTKSQNDGAAA